LRKKKKEVTECDKCSILKKRTNYKRRKNLKSSEKEKDNQGGGEPGVLSFPKGKKGGL